MWYQFSIHGHVLQITWRYFFKRSQCYVCLRWYYVDKAYSFELNNNNSFINTYEKKLRVHRDTNNDVFFRATYNVGRFRERARARVLNDRGYFFPRNDVLPLFSFLFIRNFFRITPPWKIRSSTPRSAGVVTLWPILSSVAFVTRYDVITTILLYYHRI